jgi:ketosteroid isomerase-like protein
MLTRQLIDSVFQAFSSKDLPTVMSYFSDDAVLIDPHYPQVMMQGRAAIEQGLVWGLGNLVKPGFSIRNVLISGDKAAVEVDTHHLFKGGMELKFDQMFMLESRAGKITRLQAYVPYGPPGVAGLATLLTRMGWWLQGKLQRPLAPLRPALANINTSNTQAYSGPCRRGATSTPALGRRSSDRLELHPH